jgi:tryptophan 2,3-dioxygenase
MNEFSPEVLQRLHLLQQKFAASGQDMTSYLDGLLHANYTTYWDYIGVDTLLTLQKPRTDFPDEVIFIVYHQITELYFLLLHRELDQVLALQPEQPDFVKEALKRLTRINNYMRHLADSFDVMTYGMDQQQFLKFRMSLLPASGFQTASFREIEFKLTGLLNLCQADLRPDLAARNDFDELYNHLYWKFGNREAATGEKTLTLKMFEQRYDEHFRSLARQYEGRTLNDLATGAWAQTVAGNDSVREQLKEFDLNVNVFWRLSHYRSAARYLQRDPDVIKATGGTNWQEYLPPRFQRVYFFPTFWTEPERAEWGKGWVLELFREKIEGRWSSPLQQAQ